MSGFTPNKKHLFFSVQKGCFSGERRHGDALAAHGIEPPTSQGGGGGAGLTREESRPKKRREGSRYKRVKRKGEESRSETVTRKDSI